MDGSAPVDVRAANARAAVRRWGRLALAGVAWVLLYRLNRPFWVWLLGDVLGVDLTSRAGGSLLFFVYDTTKITLLLAGIIFGITVLRSFMSVERTRALLGGLPESPF